MKVERMLFPTDFLEGSRHALPFAVDLAKHYNAKLYIVHIIYDIAMATESHIPHVSMDELYKEMYSWAEKEIEKCCVEEIRGLPNSERRVSKGAPREPERRKKTLPVVEKKVLRGIPYEEIVRFAADEKIDMIVMGTYGRKGLERMLFGSTAERVVRKAPCPVMTVRIPEHREK